MWKGSLRIKTKISKKVFLKKQYKAFENLVFFSLKNKRKVCLGSLKHWESGNLQVVSIVEVPKFKELKTQNFKEKCKKYVKKSD